MEHKKSKIKTVYLPMSADFLHHGHINIIKKGGELGRVTVGLLTDEAIASRKRVPLSTYEQRKRVVENIVGVSNIVAQESYDYVPNLKKLKPDFLVHGDDWKTGFQKELRERAIKALKEWGGKVVEPEYTKGVSSTQLIEESVARGVTPETRMKQLRRCLEVRPLTRILEVHNGLTGLIVEKTKISERRGIREFDGMWLSSLTDSISKGKPDTGCVDFSSRISTIDQIFDVTTKPMIVDGDNGGLIEHFVFIVKTLERLGVSAVIIEDKIGAKRNSLFGTSVIQNLDSVRNFSNKISVGKRAQVTDDFMVIARVESLILKKGIKDALNRTKSYIKAGADAIMIHSKDKSPKEILIFCKEYKRFSPRTPLIVVPTTYNSITEDELKRAGVGMVIYANHLLRSAYPAMVNATKSILKHSRSQEIEKSCMSVEEILTLIPGGE